MIEMIDLHAHILPRLDDGAESLEESVEMCRISYGDGVRTIVATPHILPGVYKNNRATILAKTRSSTKPSPNAECGMRNAESKLRTLTRRVLLQITPNSLPSPKRFVQAGGLITPNCLS